MNKDFSNLLSGALGNKKANDGSIKERILIKDEFKKFIPELSAEEYSQLEENILKEGVRDPLIVWQNGESIILIDGHNRFSICQKHKIDFTIKTIALKDEGEVRLWMVKNQLGRRNLSPEMLSYFRGSEYLTDIQGAEGHGVPREDRAEKHARIHAVDSKTIKRDAQFKKGIDAIGQIKPELKEKILKGKSGVARKTVQEIGKNQKLAQSVIEGLGKPEISNAHKSNPNSQQVAIIALDYIRTEKRQYDLVLKDLELDNDNFSPTEFFLAWGKRYGNINGSN